MMKAKWRIVIVLVALVLVSTGVGALLGVKYMQRVYKKRHAPELWNQTVMSALKRHLKLTPDQEQKTQAIIDRGVEEMKGIRQETIARTDTVIERLMKEIEAGLTSEQIAELDKLKQQRGATTIDMLKVEPRKK
jgi:uncharacterized FlgJ-related protein